MNLYSILSVLGIDIEINGELMHTIEIPILQHCQWCHESWSNDVSLKQFIKKIEVRIPESSYHITNNLLSSVLQPGYACKCWFWKCLLNYGWKVRRRINIRTFQVNTNCELRRQWAYSDSPLQVTAHALYILLHCGEGKSLRPSYLSVSNDFAFQHVCFR